MECEVIGSHKAERLRETKQGTKQKQKAPPN